MFKKTNQEYSITTLIINRTELVKGLTYYKFIYSLNTVTDANLIKRKIMQFNETYKYSYL